MMTAYDRATPKVRAIATYKALVDMGMISKFNSGDDFSVRALCWSEANKNRVSAYIAWKSNG